MLKKIRNILIEKSNSRIDRKDWIIIFIVCFCYGILSFWNLGSFTNPQTFTTTTNDMKVLNYKVSGGSDAISTLKYFTGPGIGSYLVLGSTDGNDYHQIGETSRDAYVFSWNEITLEKLENMKYLRLVTVDEDAILGEIWLDGGVTLIASDSNSELLIDEQKVVPDEISFYNSSYFDEVYFARAAYEYSHGIATYEWVHPPLGKLIQTIPVALFGMTPFNYRLMGNISGILLVFVMYVFGKALFKKRGYALLASLFMVLDGFHFAQTRIGTIDSHLVLFILSSYYFMYRYLELKKEERLKTRLKFLLLSGITIGCAIATKWTGLFAGLGLAILFFTHLYKTYFYKRKITVKEKHELRTIIMNCILFFVCIPIFIYVGSYFLFPKVSVYTVNNFESLISVTDGMYKYHSTLDATHPFSSEWYTWPFMIRPVWFYDRILTGGLRSTISAVGNIAIWWGGFVGLIYSIYQGIKKQQSQGFLIMIVFLCLYVPYIFIGRCMFLYHYFPVLPFAMLALTYMLKGITERTKNHWIIPVYLIICIILFIYFFPVVSGIPIPDSAINRKCWLPTWYF